MVTLYCIYQTLWEEWHILARRVGMKQWAILHTKIISQSLGRFWWMSGWYHMLRQIRVGVEEGVLEIWAIPNPPIMCVMSEIVLYP